MSRPHGIGMVYAYPLDDDGLAGTVTTMVASAGWTNVHSRAMLIRTNWDIVEPTAGNYYWAFIDAAQAQARAHHKKWILQVVGGLSAPTWLYSAPYNATAWGVQIDAVPTYQNQPLIWETAFQTRWLHLIDVICARYGNDPNLLQINIQGIGKKAESVWITYEHGGSHGGTNGVGDLEEADALAIAYGVTGYSGSPYGGHAALKGWEDAAKLITAEYAIRLVGTRVFFALVSSPPVADAALAGAAVRTDFSLWGSTTYPGRYSYESDGLVQGTNATQFSYGEIQRLNPTTLTGWQFNANPSTSAQYQATIVAGASAGCHYIETSPGSLDNAGADWIAASTLGNLIMEGGLIDPSLIQDPNRRKEMTQSEIADEIKARAVQLGTSFDAFATALASAKALSAASKVATDADGGADPDTVTAADAADAAIQSLDTSAIANFCKY